MTKKVLATIALVILAGCSNKMKKSMGMITSAPDEFQVKSVKPLEVPPHYNLPEPEINDLTHTPQQ
jgi:uncharacterized lipoprotein